MTHTAHHTPTQRTNRTASPDGGGTNGGASDGGAASGEGTPGGATSGGATSVGATSGGATGTTSGTTVGTTGATTSGPPSPEGGTKGRGTNGTASPHGGTNGGGANGRGTRAGGPHGGTAAVEGLPALRAVPKTDRPQKPAEFKTDQEVRWCPGCGDYAILAAVQSFLPELGLKRENIVFVSGIGCSSRFPYYLNTYGMHSIHGRAPAIATGLSVSRPDLSVWVVTGDGDALSIGGNHLIHALRRNVNLKILLFNNRIYGLTKGQYSPTSEVGKVTKSTPMGSLDYPFNPISLALGAEATFVARSIDSDRKHLTAVLRAAAAHEGSALVEIYQNCNIFNDGAFDLLKDPNSRDDYTIRLEHDAPLRFGPDGEHGIIRDPATGGLQVAAVADVGQDAILTHHAHLDDPSYAFALSRLGTQDLRYTPIGVFRSITRPTYDHTMATQIHTAQTTNNGPATTTDLTNLLHGGDTWTVA